MYQLKTVLAVLIVPALMGCGGSLHSAKSEGTESASSVTPTPSPLPAAPGAPAGPSEKGCTYGALQLKSGDVVTGFAQASVPFGSSCGGSAVSCANGILTGADVAPFAQCAARAPARIPSVDDYGARGDGVTDDSAAFAAAASVGGPLAMSNGKIYVISSRIVFSTSAHLFGRGSATVKLVAGGSLVIHSSNVTFERFRILAEAQSSAACAITLQNDNPNWFTNITVRSIQAVSAPCLVGDEYYPAAKGKTNSIVGLYISDLTSSAARGQQIRLRSAWAFSYLRNIQIAMAVAVSVPVVAVGPNEGLLMDTINITGAGGGEGLRISDSSAVWLSNSVISGMGGDGLVVERSVYVYWRAVTLLNNGGRPYYAANTTNFLLMDVNWANNGGGGPGESAVTGKLVNSSMAWMPAVPAALKVYAGTSVADVENYASVLDYGARGDGVTDDSAAFQRAVDSGVNVYVPAGSYRLLNTVYLRKPVRLVGEGIGRTRLISTAAHGLHVLSSAVRISGMIIHMNPAPNTIGIYLNSFYGQLDAIEIHDVDTVDAGFSVTNISTGNYPITNLRISRMRAWAPRNVAIHLTNIYAATLDRIFGENGGAPYFVNWPFVYLSAARNVLFNESTILAYGNSPAFSGATGLVIAGASSDVYVNRYQGDVNNGNGMLVSESSRIFLSDIVFTPVNPQSVPVVIDRSAVVYGVNFLFTQPAGAPVCVSSTNNQVVVLSNILSLGPGEIAQSGSRDTLFEGFSH